MVIVIDHHIQRDIILRLAKAHALRFSELKPEGMESNSFMYHLHEVMKHGLAEQRSDKTYALTPAGMSYFDGITLTNNKPRRQPKLICILALRNKQGEYLLAQRMMQPSLGTWMLPSGKQHFGESTIVHAQRELREQFGLDLPLKRQGMLDIRIRHGDTTVTHLVSQVFTGNYDGDVPEPTDRFVYAWQSISDVSPLTPGTAQLIEALGQDDFFLDLEMEADD